jgi:hypothetical protein
MIRELPEAEKAFKLEFDLADAIPDTSTAGVGTVRWRNQGDQDWRSAKLTTPISPTVIKRVYPFDGKLLCFTGFYGPAFIYDPATKATRMLGRPGFSVYDAQRGADGRWYIAGYAAASAVWDPAQPWTASASALPGTPGVNPAKLPLQAGKYHYYHAVATAPVPDGAPATVLFAGAHHERDSTGAELGWLNVQSGEKGRIRDPLVEYEPGDLLTADTGKLVVLSTAARQKDDSGKLFVVDAVTRQLVRTIAPVAGLADAGKITEVAPGEVVGVIKGTPNSRVYRANVTTGTTLWDKELPGVAFGGMRGYDRRVVLGPDGGLYFYLTDGIARLDPADGSVTQVVKAPLSCPVFLGRDLYLYGDTNLRVVRGVAPFPAR